VATPPTRISTKPEPCGNEIRRRIGRAFLYGLAVGGEAGVRRALDLIRTELEVSMALTGQRDVRAIARDVIATA